MRRALLVAIAVLALAPSADAARPYLGVRGNMGRFQAQTGQQSSVGHVIALQVGSPTFSLHSGRGRV